MKTAKTLGKAVLAGLAALLAAWVFLALFGESLALEAATSYVVFACFYLAFEIAFCTVLVLEKLNGRGKQ